MKVMYCNHSVYNPGGMERVMINKIRYLVEVMRWEVVLVTTDQKNRPPFYPLPHGVRMMDLGINYSDDNHLPTLSKVAGYLRRRRMHKRRLTALLQQERPDILVSLFPSESSFLPDLKDGSRKVLELHFNKFFRLQYGRTGLYGLLNRWRTKQDERLVRRFDRFVVLTDEDKGYWGDTGNIEVIPNAALVSCDGEKADVAACRRIIAVGRLDHQKSFDRLIEAWEVVQKEQDLHDWRLDIFGQGEWESMLKDMIREKGLGATAQVNAPTKAISEEYRKSAFLVMSSRYEGFPMVMIEAMAQGLPVVTFDFKCGPKDIIEQDRNGVMVPEGNVPALAQAMVAMMRHTERRVEMGREARAVTERFSEERVMQMWLQLFESLKR